MSTAPRALGRLGAAEAGDGVVGRAEGLLVVALRFLLLGAELRLISALDVGAVVEAAVQGGGLDRVLEERDEVGDGDDDVLVDPERVDLRSAARRASVEDGLLAVFELLLAEELPVEAREARVREDPLSVLDARRQRLRGAAGARSLPFPPARSFVARGAGARVRLEGALVLEAKGEELDEAGALGPTDRDRVDRPARRVSNEEAPSPPSNEVAPSAA